MKRASQTFVSETDKLIESLREHRVELELQNQELLLAKERGDLAVRKYTELYHFAPVGYFTLSQGGRIIELNFRGSQMLGKERDILINAMFEAFVADETKEVFNQFLETVFSKNGGNESCEVILTIEGKEPLFVELTSLIIESGNCCFLTAIDITKRKRDEKNLRQSRILMNASLESQLGMIIMSIDTDYRYLYFNNAHSELMKSAYLKEIEIGMNILECINSEIGSLLAKDDFDRVFRGESHSKVWKFKDPDQNFYESFFNPIFNETFEIVGASIFSRNITDRRRKEELINKNKARLDKTEEIAHLGSWELDLRSGIITWSDEVFSIFGYNPHEFEPTYEAFLASVHPDDRELVNRAFLDSVQLNKPGYEIEHRLILNNSEEIRFVLEKCEHIRNEAGEIIRSVGMVQDITENKRSAIALVASHEKYRDLVELAVDGVLVASHEGFITDANSCLCQMLGIQKGDLIGTYFGNLIFPVKNPDQKSPKIEELREGEVMISERSFMRHDGNQISVEIRTKMMPNKTYQSIFRDITENKKAEKALKESESRVKALLAAIPDMMFIQNRDGVYLDYHGPLSSELYLKPEFFIGKNIREVLPTDLSALFITASNHAIETNQVQLVEYSLNLPDGIKYFECKMVAYDGDKILSIVRDISPYREAEEIIRLRNLDLQKINGEKDKFFSIIAHDLRGPFSGFLSLTETLAKRLPDMTLKEIQEITLMMRKSAVHLFRLLGNLLEWSRLQRGLIVFQPKTFILRPKIDTSISFITDMASNKEISINSLVSDDMVVNADENMLESILRNLLTNAVKFTKKGGAITISAQKCSDKFVEISVIDTGIGMNQHLLNQLFRLDVITNRKGTGGEYSSGLGLIICRDLIEKHGGRLEVDSEEGKGSTFRFTLPFNNLA